MFCENELRFLCDTLKKSRVRTLIGTPNELLDLVPDVGLEGLLSTALLGEISAHWLLEKIEPETVYKLTDPLGLCYTYFLLPASEYKTVIVIGPYLSAPPIPEQLPEIGEQLGISPHRQRFLEEYYMSIPVLAEGNHLLMMLDTFCERMWERPSFAIVDVNKLDPLPVSPINEPLHSNGFDDVLVNMKTMEKRYAFENEILRAVSLGQIHKEKLLVSAFNGSFFEKRLSDPLRNAKNYCIIMNTLLRKAAESGGVHPVYIDRISAEFAAKIERMQSITENTALMREMFRGYCRLVRKHALQKFSLVVQKTILVIDSDLSADLSLRSLAEAQNVSLGYLSTVFKRETGKTVSEFIREKRMKHAAHLLGTTKLQIQTVALHCGIMDVQYFSKLFKRQTGKSPREYREEIQN